MCTCKVTTLGDCQHEGSATALERDGEWHGRWPPESIKDSIEAAILVDDQGMLDIFKDAAIETEGFSVAVKSAENAQTAFDNAQKNLNTTGSTRLKLLNQLAEKEGTNKLLTGEQLSVSRTLNESEKAYIQTLSAKRKADEAVTDARKEMTVTELQAQGVERDGTELTKDRVDLEAKRVSALEGSREAVSKFQAAFQQTTKIDENN